jgi:hypothetical protein
MAAALRRTAVDRERLQVGDANEPRRYSAEVSSAPARK